MNTIIDRAVNALELAMDQASSGDYSLHKEGYEKLVLAVINAIAEPTPEMVDAAWAAATAEDAAGVWYAMIKHILVRSGEASGTAG